MDTYPLNRSMPNGASVNDWLGTAKTAAELAVSDIERVRDGRGRHTAKTLLDQAEGHLLQSLQELREVRAFVEN